MARVTSKRQVTIPKAIADRYDIAPGDEIEFKPAGEAIRVEAGARAQRASLSRAQRLQLFDRATERQRGRQRRNPAAAGGRGWRREDLYGRGQPG